MRSIDANVPVIGCGGIRILFGSTAESIAAHGDGLKVRVSTGEDLHPDTVLFAAGRSANTDGLGLEAAGVNLDSRGRIVVDQNFHTSVEGIYAAGDVLGPTLASTAMEQGRLAICHAFSIPVQGTGRSPRGAIAGRGGLLKLVLLGEPYELI
jgi:NAD(P) transhydrogenase